MPAALQSLIDNQDLRLLYIYSEWHNMYNDFYALAGQLSDEGNPGSAQGVYNVCVHMLNIRDYIGTGSDCYKYTEHATLNWINDNWPSGVDVTMDAILNAMLKSDFDQLQKFIGIADAYRVAIWNAPFNADFYAALARGFQQWP